MKKILLSLVVMIIGLQNCMADYSRYGRPWAVGDNPSSFSISSYVIIILFIIFGIPVGISLIWYFLHNKDKD